ncbi:MAG: tRNA dihydrouridine(20/20a) synthase DusA [Terricaulis silvestris]
MKIQSHRFSVAPMMDWTDRHCRAFHRGLTKRALLYTEMLTADAVIHGDRQRLLGYSPEEHPVALQLGGSEPEKLGEAARIGADFGYAEINLNVGCPSDRVQAGRFGACLMREPALVAELWSAMQAAAPETPVTIKSRLGVDEQEPRDALFDLVERVAAAGCRTFVVHARKAWLKGLSPKDNREIPPLDYGLVRDLKAARPDLEIILNGGLTSLDQALRESGPPAPPPAVSTDVGEFTAGEVAGGPRLDGVMFGRAAYQDPALLLDVDHRIFGEAANAMTRADAVEAHLPYIEARLREGVPLHAMTRHMLGLFHAQPGGRQWRRVLSEQGVRAGAGVDVVRAALAETQRSFATAL